MPPKSGDKSSPMPPQLHPEVLAAQAQDVLSLLFIFRFVNALCLRTFFQPDEYFQALEPAWSVAFGSEAGAWRTWVNENSELPLFPPGAFVYTVCSPCTRSCLAPCTMPPMS
jgi:hypothetical protein